MDLLTEQERDAVANTVEFRCMVLLKLKAMDKIPSKVSKLEAYNWLYAAIILALVIPKVVEACTK